MIRTCLGSGFRAALRHRRMIATLWVWNLLLAGIVGAGAWRWLGAAFDFSPEADRWLQRFQFSLLVELQQYDRFSPFLFMNGAVLALLALSVVSNPLLSAGVLEVLVSRDDRPLLHRFFRGAGHFFGRFLRLLAITAAVFIVLMIIVTAITAPISRAFDRGGWEYAWLATGLFRLVLLGLLAAFLMAVLDIARTRVVTAPTELRGMVRTWPGAARFALAHLGSLTGIYLLLGIIWVVLAGAGLAVVSITPVTNWAGLWLLIGVQQVFMIARAGLRIARAGSIVELVGAATPMRMIPVEAAAPRDAAGQETGGAIEVTGSIPPR